MKKKLIVILVGVALAVPAFAVFNERNISRTISVLRHELHLAYTEQMEMNKRHEHSSEMEQVQRRKMVDMVEKINESMLILYSQDRDFTFDQAYALDGVREEYKKFSKHRQPNIVSIEDIDSEIERYRNLVDALKLLPPKIDDAELTADITEEGKGEIDGTDEEMAYANILLDSLMASFYEISVSPEQGDDASGAQGRRKRGFLKEINEYNKGIRKESRDTSDSYSFVLSQTARVDRDSCIVYANSIIESLIGLKEKVTDDELYYNEMSRRFQQTYDYATECYVGIQEYIFDGGQENYFAVLGNLRKYIRDMSRDLQQKYSSKSPDEDEDELWGSEWRGFVLASAIFYMVFTLLMVSAFVMLLSRVILKKVKPFNTEFFRMTRPATTLLLISVSSSIIVTFQRLYPMSNFSRMGSSLLLVYFGMITALMLSVLVGMKREDTTEGLKVYLPVMTVGFIVLMLRILFVPDKLIHLILSPLMLLFFVWQLVGTLRFRTRGYKFMLISQWISLCVFGMAFIMSMQGFSLLGLQMLMWWLFQITAIATVVSCRYALKYYYDRVLMEKIASCAKSDKMVSKDEEGDFIKVTWLFDLLYKMLLPVAGILSFVFCLNLSADIFNLSETFKTILTKPFFDFKSADGNPVLQVSLIKLVIVSVCFFIFRYLNYLFKSLYRVNTLERLVEKSGGDMVRKNDVNLTLAYNVIGIIIWGLYIAYSIYILKIPIGALSIVAAGLATGIGLALKDVLNNFIYGIQLMSGRLRVGDMVECDGIRGTVEKISYQSTEILTLNGSVISFTNSALFNKNFQNLTKNSPYEFVSIVVSISYGEDVNKVRNMLEEALEGYRKKKDRYGRYLIEKKGGISISFSEFCDSSVNLSINQRVLVESKSAYIAEINELVYKVFNENGIVIPFPQQEVSILNLPQAHQCG